MSERLRAEHDTELLPFLVDALPGWGRNTLRERIDRGCVRVNGAVVTRRNERLSPGDEVTVDARGDSSPAPSRAPFPVLHEDEHLVAIDKPVGLLSVSTERERERTALALLRRHLERPRKPAPLWPVHRLDRETSGVLLFARSAEVRDDVQASWKEARKVYRAVVLGHPSPPEGSIDVPLWEDAGLRVHAGQGPGARPARTRYRTLERSRERALLEVELDTGRRQQIRAHLAHLGCPVVGDDRRASREARLGLHALRLELVHPRTGAALVLEARAPKAFLELLGVREEA